MTSRSERPGAGGFTLIEILAVLAILGFVLSLVAMRGPGKPVRLDLRAAAGQIADTLRLARARAVAGNRAVDVLLDREGHRVLPAGGKAQGLPPEIDMVLLGIGGPVEASRLVVRFTPDGGSTGGGVELVAGQRRIRVGASWLSGHVAVFDVP